jgi:hypothetical protein
MVNKENIAKWVAALRSGNFKQGHGYLCSYKETETGRDYRYCCLGVACQLLAEEDNTFAATVIPKQVKEEEGGYYTQLFGAQRALGRLPVEVTDWLGIDSVYGNPKFMGLHAIHMNDDHRLSFNEIADRIEQEFRLNED